MLNLYLKLDVREWCVTLLEDAMWRRFAFVFGPISHFLIHNTYLLQPGGCRSHLPASSTKPSFRPVAFIKTDCKRLKNIVLGSPGTQSWTVSSLCCLFLKKQTNFLNQTFRVKCFFLLNIMLVFYGKEKSFYLMNCLFPFCGSPGTHFMQ